MENCWEEVPHSSQDYYPHYNLFQSSIFYDTDNFRISYLTNLTYGYGDCMPTESGTHCAQNQERSAEPPDKPPDDETKLSENKEVIAPVPENKEKPFVSKEELYQDPDLFSSKNEDVQSNSPTEPAYLASSQPWGYDWTRQSWVKGGGKLVVMSKKEERKEEWRSKQKLYKKLANAPRIKSIKAENMMQKMGWQGGALGKAGRGILEPVTPDPIYASTRSVGFGQRTKVPPKVPPTKHSKRDAFRTNALLYILEFVQDDTEVELCFDTSLSQHERRSLHTLVHSVLSEGNVAGLSSVAQYELVADIHKCNQYELGTHSEGEPPDRQITIYKEAPEHVYLVTPEDFQPKDNTSTDEEQTTTTNINKENETLKDDPNKVKSDDKIPNTNGTVESKQNDAMEMDDDENPFLKSIKKSLKRDDEPRSITNKFEKDCNIEECLNSEPVTAAPREKIVEFFQEFAGTDDYKELWFLGKFTADEILAINEFLNDVATCIEDVKRFEGDEEISKVFKSGGGFKLKEGCNGTTEIHKVPRRPLK